MYRRELSGTSNTTDNAAYSRQYSDISTNTAANADPEIAYLRELYKNHLRGILGMSLCAWIVGHGPGQIL